MVLGNPASPETLVVKREEESPLSKRKGTEVKFATGATLVVVPTTLLPQWWEEIENRTTCGNDRSDGHVKAINISGPKFVVKETGELLIFLVFSAVGSYWLPLCNNVLI